MMNRKQARTICDEFVKLLAPYGGFYVNPEHARGRFNGQIVVTLSDKLVIEADVAAVSRWIEGFEFAMAMQKKAS